MQIPVGNWGGVDLVVDQSIGECDSSLGSLVRKKRQEAIPWCPPRGVSRSVLYSKRLSYTAENYFELSPSVQNIPRSPS